jgi:acetyl esterase/lipase
MAEDLEATTAPRPPERRVARDVQYAPGSARRRLDISLPAEGDGPFPVIVYVHPGGYVAGDKSLVIAGLEELAHERGYAFVSVGYRLIDQADWPAQIVDVKSGISWVRAHADEYAIDAERIGVWGVSAGGHLAALAGTSGNADLFSDPSAEHSATPSTVAAVIDWFGPTDFVALQQYLRAERERTEVRQFQLEFITRQIAASPGSVANANPATHADANDPPLLIQHGSEDVGVPAAQSRQFAETAARKMGKGKVTYEEFEGLGHAAPEFYTRRNVERNLDFLDAHLR